MLTGAYSTPINTSPAAGPEGSGTSASSSTSVGSPKALISAARMGDSSIDSVVAEIDEVATGERAARLLQATAGRETAKVDRHEAEALDHALDEFCRLGVIPGDEDDAATTILYGPFIEARGDDRIESLHHPGARRQAGYHFARPFAASMGERSVRVLAGGDLT